MGRFSCKCGHLFTNTLAPDKHLNYLVNDVPLTNESDFGEKLVNFLKEDSTTTVALSYMIGWPLVL